MSNQKRRVIYMTDQEWTELARKAKARDISASAYIRAVTVGEGFATPEGFAEMVKEYKDRPNPYAAIVAGFGHPVAAPKPARKGKS